jgi:hypothetical protein
MRHTEKTTWRPAEKRDDTQARPCACRGAAAGLPAVRGARAIRSLLRSRGVSGGGVLERRQLVIV